MDVRIRRAESKLDLKNLRKVTKAMENRGSVTSKEDFRDVEKRSERYDRRSS